MLCVGTSLCVAQDNAAEPALDSPLEPQELFVKMAQANASQAYAGSLAFERAGQLATYRVENQIEVVGDQRLESLNRLLPAQIRSSFCTRSQLGSAENLAALSSLYNFYRPGETVVAGREAIELLMLPVDANRYGYGFSVDAETYLPLRTVVLTPQRVPVERYEYVDIEFLDLPAATPECTVEPTDAQQASWSANTLPSGFYVTHSKYLRDLDKSMMVVSDGLATISISIEPVEAPKFPPVTTRLGATNILLSYLLNFQRSTYLATLVGEVPLQSLELIASGLGPAPISSDD